MPGLVWNTMMSMSGGWFFVVASEAITVGDTTVDAARHRLLHRARASSSATSARDRLRRSATMLVVILLYDQLLFRPLVAWADKFRFEQTAGAARADAPGCCDLMRAHAAARRADLRRSRPCAASLGALAARLPSRAPSAGARAAVAPGRRGLARCSSLVVAGYALWQIVAVRRRATLRWDDVVQALRLGAAHAGARHRADRAREPDLGADRRLDRAAAARWRERVQPLAQFLAAFPANLLFPLGRAGHRPLRPEPDIWLSPLMILGTQWYILFNVIAGAARFPTDLREAASNFRIGGWLWWRKVMLPGDLPVLRDRRDHRLGRLLERRIVAEVASAGATPS